MIKLSVSSIDTFKKCAKKYFYRYIERVEVDKKKWNFTEFGSCAHRILELFHEKADLNTDPKEYSSIMKKCFVALQSNSFTMYNFSSSNKILSSLVAHSQKRHVCFGS